MPRTIKGFALVLGALVALTLTEAAHAQKKTLVVALNQDPDILDPTLARTYVGRIIFPRCARSSTTSTRGCGSIRSWPPRMPAITDGGQTVTIKLRSGVKFNDGTPMDAESVQFLAGPAPHPEGLESAPASSHRSRRSRSSIRSRFACA